jgi:ATP-dependent RNA helicase DHX37/DHR1
MLAAIGAYLSQPASELASFCATHYLREKQMDEVGKLIQQLGNISKTVFKLDLDLHLTLRPPTDKEKSLLKQIILSGYVDCVARLDPEHVAGYGKHALPVYETIWSLPTEQFVIHATSCIFRERPPPKWIVFDQIQGKQQMHGADGSLLDLRSKDGFDRKFLKNVTIVRDSWILNQVPSLTNEGKMLDHPEPRYHPESDCVKGFIAPTLGPKFWALPMTEKILNSGKEASAWFSKSLLEGQVDFGLKNSKNPFFVLLVINF